MCDGGRRPTSGRPDPGIRRVCIIGASGKLGRHLARHCLDRGYEVIGVCREQSVGKLAQFEGRITVVPGATNDRESRHVGAPILASNRTRRVDFALFMVEALTDDALVHEAPAIVGRGTPSPRAHATA